MAKPDHAPVMALLDALANDNETPIATLKRILRERDDLLKKAADTGNSTAASALAAVVNGAGSAAIPVNAQTGFKEPSADLNSCNKHARGFRGANCPDCVAEALDAGVPATPGATSIAPTQTGIVVGRGATPPEAA